MIPTPQTARAPGLKPVLWIAKHVQLELAFPLHAIRNALAHSR
jgi:hypothetical protein